MRPVTFSPEDQPSEYLHKTLKRRYHWFDGRINRGDYWMSGLLGFIAFLFLLFVSGLVKDYVSSWLGAMMFILNFLAMAFFLVTQSAKRCHDIGVNGWLQFVPLFVLLLLFKSGDKGANEFGPDPNKGVEKDPLGIRRAPSTLDTEIDALYSKPDPEDYI
jgi:uncharacterized membrane protein YhaH (DUF805 family)